MESSRQQYNTIVHIKQSLVLLYTIFVGYCSSSNNKNNNNNNNNLYRKLVENYIVVFIKEISVLLEDRVI